MTRSWNGLGDEGNLPDLLSRCCLFLECVFHSRNRDPSEWNFRLRKLIDAEVSYSLVGYVSRIGKLSVLRPLWRSVRQTSVSIITFRGELNALGADQIYDLS